MVLPLICIKISSKILFIVTNYQYLNLFQKQRKFQSFMLQDINILLYGCKDFF